MGAYKMVWYGAVVPYVRTTQRQKWVDKRYKRYQAWKDAFRLSANTQGFPSELDPSKCYSFVLRLFVSGYRRWDCDNAGKGALDSLFEQDNGVSEIYVKAEEYTGVDRVEVELVERGPRVTSSTRRTARTKPVRSGRKAMRGVGGSLSALGADVQGDRPNDGDPESPHMGGL